MYVKVCPCCQGKSYSAADDVRWICPYCGADLTDQPAEVAVAWATED